MAEKDHKKVEEKAGLEMDTVEQSLEMKQFIETFTAAFGTIQKNFEVAQPLAPDQTQQKEFTGNAKIAVEKLNDILAGLQLKPSLTPMLNPLISDPALPPQTMVKLTWSMPEQVDTLNGFKIQRAEESSDQFMDIPLIPPVPVLPVDKRDYTDTPVDPKRPYRYRVVALTSTRGEFVSNIQPIQLRQA